MRKDREICMLYDKDIREPLFDFLEEAYGKLRIMTAFLTAIWWWQVPATRPMSGNMFRDGGGS